jgi:transcriptional regulator with XRE-family HTH domain
MNIASQLRVAREASGLTQAAVSRASGIAVPNLSTIERGKVDFRLSTLVRILDALELDIQLVPRTRQISLGAAIARSEQGRLRLAAAGIAPSDPQKRLDAKRTRGIDVSAEQSFLDANARYPE